MKFNHFDVNDYRPMVDDMLPQHRILPCTMIKLSVVSLSFTYLLGKSLSII
jgi:hypothetical protein